MSEGYYVNFAECSRERYGQIVHSKSYTDWFSGESMLAADGLEILEIQEKVMGFLVDICKCILKDKGDDLTDEAHPTLDRLPPLKLEDSDWRSIPVLALNAPYTAPGSVELDRLKDFVGARLLEAQDHILALREDPGYFADCLKEWNDHQCIWILDKNRKVPATVAATIKRGQIWDSMVPIYITTAYEDAYWWNTLHQQLNEVIRLDRNFIAKGIKKEEGLPGYVDSLQKLKHLMIRPVEHSNFQRLSVNYPSSPGFRNNFAVVIEQHEQGHAMTVRPQREDDGETGDYLVWLLNRMHDKSRVTVMGMANLSLEIERLLQSDAKQKARVTPLLANLLSDIGLVSEVYHQLERYRPRIFLTRRGSKVLAQREWALVESAWAKSLEAPLKGISKALSSQGPQLGRVGDPTTGNFNYPSTKRKTKDNIAAMQSAERHLDNLWAKVDDCLQKNLRKASLRVVHELTPSLKDLN